VCGVPFSASRAVGGLRLRMPTPASSCVPRLSNVATRDVSLLWEIVERAVVQRIRYLDALYGGLIRTSVVQHRVYAELLDAVDALQPRDSRVGGHRSLCLFLLHQMILLCSNDERDRIDGFRGCDALCGRPCASCRCDSCDGNLLLLLRLLPFQEQEQEQLRSRIAVANQDF
jgi:hypothetical protein